MKNPFIVGRPITDPKDFFDREKELGGIFRGIENQYNISLMGERKIGKTSLLNMICHPDKMREFRIDAEKTLILSIDSGEVDKGSPASVWKSLLSSLIKEIENRDVKKNLNKKIRSNEVGLYEFFEAVSHTEKNIVIIFDEFEAICEDMDINFFQDLRHIGQVSKLTYIVSTCRDLFTLTTKSKKIKSSPFFNIFVPYYLGLFQKDQSEKFIEAKFKDMNIQKEHVISILRICGPHPFFLQLFCSHLFELLTDEELDLSFEEGIKQARMKFTESSDTHFEYFWERFNSKEERILLDIALKGRKGLSFKKIFGDMVRRGFLVEDKGEYELFSEAFREWILENIERPQKFSFLKMIAFAALLAVVIFFFWMVLDLICS